jgi:hypothetical protein
MEKARNYYLFGVFIFSRFRGNNYINGTKEKAIQENP